MQLVEHVVNSNLTYRKPTVFSRKLYLQKHNQLILKGLVVSRLQNHGLINTHTPFQDMGIICKMLEKFQSWYGLVSAIVSPFYSKERVLFLFFVFCFVVFLSLSGTEPTCIMSVDIVVQKFGQEIVEIASLYSIVSRTSDRGL